MKKYIEFKIMKINLLLIGIILAIASGLCGYYIWCAYHPVINIKVSGGSIKENLKIETPTIAYAGRWYAEPAASIALNLFLINMQSEYTTHYIKNTYKESDIKLDIIVKENKTILKYFGTATTLDGEVVDFKREIPFEFALDANIVDD